MSLQWDDELGPFLKTNKDGTFKITYSKWAYGLESAPDIVVKVYDPVYRLLHESEVFRDVQVEMLTVPDIVLPTRWVRGWLVTLGTDEAQFIAPQGNHVQLLVNNARAWDQLTQDVSNAEASIFATQVMWDIGRVYTRFPESVPCPATQDVPGGVKGATRLEEIVATKSFNNNAQVHVILNDIIGLPYPFDSADLMDRFLAEQEGHQVKFLQYRMPVTNVLNAKMFALDGTPLTTVATC